MAAGAERVQGNLLLLEFRGVSGAARVDSREIRQGEGRVRPYAERQRAGGWTDLAGDYRELSAGRRQRGRAGGVAPLSGCRGNQSDLLTVQPRFFRDHIALLCLAALAICLIVVRACLQSVTIDEANSCLA